MAEAEDAPGGNKDQYQSGESSPDPSHPLPPAPWPSYRLHRDNREIIRPNVRDGGSSGCGRTSPSLHLFSNERVRVSDFRLQPGKSTRMTHKRPTVRWQVAYNDIAEHSVEITREGAGDDAECRERAVLRGTVADRKVFFVKPGTAWDITNESKDTEYRQIVFEFMSDTPKHTKHGIRDMFSKAIYSTDVGTELLFENELCRCWDFYLDPSEGGGADTVHHHCLDYVFINIAPSRLLGIHPITLSLDDLLFDSVSEDNQVTWNSIPSDAVFNVDYAHGGKNGYDDQPMREYLVELK